MYALHKDEVHEQTREIHLGGIIDSSFLTFTHALLVK